MTKNLSKNKISELTRKDIFDYLVLEGVSWAGRLDECDFLSRIYKINEMESYDGRFPDAAGDIWQHRINNYDWDDDWVFDDKRFGLRNGSDNLLLDFLSEMLHPAVRFSSDDVDSLSEELNVFLRRDGFHLVKARNISGKPVFEWEHITTIENPAFNAAKSCFIKIDTEELRRQITRMESAIDSDPCLAIGTAKELIESICKTIICERTNESPSTHKMNKLVRHASELLSLTPQDVPDEAKASDQIKKILGSLSVITQGIAELRNSYGTGHGKKAGAKGLNSRHARLVVGVASSLAIFLWESHQEKVHS